MPDPLLIKNAPTPPAIPPIPVTVAIADLGNISPIVEKILALQAWWAAPAIPMIITGNHTDTVPKGCANSASNGKKAKINMERILPAYGFIPFFSTKYVGNQPPTIESNVIK